LTEKGLISKDISFNELFLIEVCRNFYFLGKIGYSVNNIFLYYPEPVISFKAAGIKKKFSIGLNVYQGSATVWFTIHNYSFSLKKNAINFNKRITEKYPEIELTDKVDNKNMGEVLFNYSNFIQKNFMPIMEGKVWDTEYASLIQKG